MNVREEIVRIIRDILKSDESLKINDNTDLMNDLNFNSIDFVKLVVQIENSFNIEFEDEKLNFNNFNSFHKLVEYVNQLLKKD